MFEETEDVRQELENFRLDHGLKKRIPCTWEENQTFQNMVKAGQALPEGVQPYIYDTGEVSNTSFYRPYEADLTEAEIREYLQYKQLAMVRTIKNCVLFFTITAIVGLSLSLIAVLSAL